MAAIRDHRKALFQCMFLLRGLQREAEVGSPVRVPAWGDVREYDALALEALWEGLDKLDTDLWFQEVALGRNVAEWPTA